MRGYSRYNEAKTEASEASPPGEDGEETLDVQDPAITLVQCDKNIFLALFQVLGIRRDGKDLSSIPSSLLREPNVRVHGQIMKLGLIQSDAGTGWKCPVDVPDWEWNGSFESQGVLRDLHGHSIEQVDPQLQRASRGRNIGEDTYVFKTAELRCIAAMMYE